MLAASKYALLGLLCGVLIVAPACNFATGLEEAAKVITEVAPFVNLIPAFVCPFNAGACAAVTATEAIADPAMTAVSNYFNAWSAASAAAQPGILGQLMAALETARQDQGSLIAAAHVDNAAAQTKINGIASSIEGSMEDLVTLLRQAQAGGGTTAALAKILEEATPEWEASPVLLATWVANPLRMFASANTLKLKSGAKVHTYRYRKGQIASVLGTKTGNAAVDGIAAAKLKTLKAL
jgi:hypothetical protein